MPDSPRPSYIKQPLNCKVDAILFEALIAAQAAQPNWTTAVETVVARGLGAGAIRAAAAKLGIPDAADELVERFGLGNGS